MSDRTVSSAFACPSCGKSIHAPLKFIGLPMECPHCGSVVTMPEPVPQGPAPIPPPPQPKPTSSEDHETSVDRKKRRRLITGIALAVLLFLLILALLTRGGAGGGARGKRGTGSNRGSGAAIGSQQDGTLPYDAGKGNHASGDPSRESAAVDSKDSSKTILFERSSPFDGIQGGAGSIGGGGTSFFGLSAAGGSFVYIVDCSGSMRGNKLKIAKESLLASISQLDDKQEFFVFFYNSKSYWMLNEKKMVAATTENKDACRKWVGAIQAQDSTMPESSLKSALKMRPDVIFFMSDGQFDSTVCDRIKAIQGAEPITIHTIGFGEGAREDVLKRLASDSGGMYHFVPLASGTR